jgi:O-antigen ligase
MPARAWKRRLARRALLAAPVVLLYVAVGWDRGGRLFAPVQTLRTLTDPGVDSSTRWREIENWNLAVSMRAHPVLGLGLGGEYVEVARNDDISTVFAEYRAWPHNSVLALLLFAGPLGFTALWAVLPLVLFLAARAYPRSRSADDRVAALACIATAIGCAVLAFGDTGAHFVQYRVLLGVAVAVSGKLAVATGAWPARRARTSAAGGVLAGGSSP